MRTRSAIWPGDDRHRDLEPLISLSDITEVELLMLKRMREFTIGEHASRFHGSGFDFVGLRDWQAGDRFSAIDWPQSSLTNFSPLIIREFEQPSTSSVVMVADRSLSTRCGIDGVAIAVTIARALATIGLSAVFFQDSIGLVTFDHGFSKLQGLRPRIGKGQVIHCLDAYQYGEGLQELRHTGDLAASLAGFMRKTSMVPIISDFLFDGVDALMQEIGHLNSLHDVFIGIVDASFAFELPGVSAGWIEAFDVESGRSRVMSRRELRAMAGRVREWQGEVAQAAKRSGLDALRLESDPTKLVRLVRQVMMCGAVRRARLRGLQAATARSRRSSLVMRCERRQMHWAFLLLALLPAMSQAQTTAQNVEVDPVTCWWRTDVTSVRLGQPFSVVLTCSVLETEATRAVVDRSRLGSAAVQFPPYEVLGGSQGPDHVTPGRRFMQYEYSLRLISEDAFGVDVPVPGLDVAYRIESRVQQDAAVQGREQSYELPPIPMRVASLVPDAARGIRESSVPTFGAIAAREFRARMFRVVALILFGVAGLTVVVALVRWVRQNRSHTLQAARPLLPNRAVLAAVNRELRAVQGETRGAGWSVESVARTLAAARLVASYLTARAVVQRTAADRPAGDGELLISGRWLSQRRIAVSGAATAPAEGAASADFAATDLDSALRQLTTARYGRSAELDASALDDALDTVMRAADRAAARHTRLAETTGALRQSLRGWRPRAWAR